MEGLLQTYLNFPFALFSKTLIKPLTLLKVLSASFQGLYSQQLIFFVNYELPIKLECYITLSCKDLPGTNNIKFILFVNYKENEVLRIQTQVPNLQTIPLWVSVKMSLWIDTLSIVPPTFFVRIFFLFLFLYFHPIRLNLI